MEYIKDSALEALFFLLFNDEPYNIHCFWHNHLYKNMNNMLKFVDYFDKIGASKAVEAEIDEEKNLIAVKLKDRTKLRQFLKEYITLYKKGELVPSTDVNYFSYSRNLEYMEKVLINSSENYEIKSFSLVYANMCGSEQVAEYKTKRLRLIEFALDCYFQDITDFVGIINCKKHAIKCVPLNETISITFKLNKPPQELYDFLVSRKSDWDIFLEKTDDYTSERIIEDRWVTKRNEVNLKGCIEVKHKDKVKTGVLQTNQNWKIFQYLLERNHAPVKMSDVIEHFEITSRDKSRPEEKALYTYISDIRQMLKDIHVTEKNYITSKNRVLYPKIP